MQYGKWGGGGAQQVTEMESGEARYLEFAGEDELEDLQAENQWHIRNVKGYGKNIQEGSRTIFKDHEELGIITILPTFKEQGNGAAEWQEVVQLTTALRKKACRAA